MSHARAAKPSPNGQKHNALPLLSKGSEYAKRMGVGQPALKLLRALSALDKHI